jgi:hypothetical protein
MGFMRAIAKITGERSENRVTPDAFIIDQPQKAVIVYEVEYSNRCSPDKIERFRNLAWRLDDKGWTLFLIQIDRYGGIQAGNVIFDELAAAKSLPAPKRRAAPAPLTDIGGGV